MRQWPREELIAMRKGAGGAFLIGTLAIVALSLRQTAEAQKYRAEDPVPPGAMGTVLPLHGTVTNLNGLGLGVGGKVAGLNATLKDLGAKVTDGEIHVELAADVLFDFDKFTLRPVANDTLKKVGQVVAGYPDAPLLIEGYTDGKGTHDYNIKLSQNRAAAVKKWLVDKAGIKASRIATKGLGESKPVAPNRKPDGSDDPEGRQKNRRVELTLSTKS
jgi:outer membrane protein OmpA-like peptidoglycan-associated protein